MSIKVPTNRLIVSSIKRYAGFYQQLLSSAVSFQDLGNMLIRAAEVARAFRQTERIEEIGSVLSNLPVKEYQLIGQYYLGLCAYRKGEDAQHIFENVIEQSNTFKPRALLSLAAVEARQGNHDAEVRYFAEAAKYADSVTTLVKAYKGIAVVKSKEGHNRASLKDFEALLSLAQLSEPIVYYDYLNSYAAELGEAGRKDEARNVIKHVIASPFALAYPEWQETANELKEASRSFVAVPQIVPKPVKTPQPVIKPKQQPASVLSFPKLKEVPLPEKPEKVSQQDVEDMDLTEMRETIMAAIRSGAIPQSEYKRMMYMHGLVKNSPASKVIDLEDEALLADIIIEWCNMIEPEQFTAVMSALRDCKDDYRRDVIIDNMITLAFQQTRDCIDSETEWRQKVERRLPKK